MLKIITSLSATLAILFMATACTTNSDTGLNLNDQKQPRAKVAKTFGFDDDFDATITLSSRWGLVDTTGGEDEGKWSQLYFRDVEKRFKILFTVSGPEDSRGGDKSVEEWVKNGVIPNLLEERGGGRRLEGFSREKIHHVLISGRTAKVVMYEAKTAGGHKKNMVLAYFSDGDTWDKKSNWYWLVVLSEDDVIQKGSFDVILSGIKLPPVKKAI